jgi:3-oxoacyl-[acyl-carrier-protein] synthase II
MKKPLTYINGVGVISPQRTFNNAEFFSSPEVYEQNVLKCITPDFKDYLSPTQLRRLGRMLRIGLSAATICIRDSGQAPIDGIITSTGYGLLRDTAVFMNEILDQNEQHITPTHFMQSTYNAIGGMVALSIQCKGYNNTYVSKGFAFETALDDAILQLRESPSQRFVVGAYDEADETQYRTHLRAGYYKKEFVRSTELVGSNTPGTIQGEAAAFFCLSGEADVSTWCGLVDVLMVYKPDKSRLETEFTKFLADNNMSVNDIDVVLNGSSGDVDHDAVMRDLTKSFSGKPQAFFKNYCGEFCTSSAFALWLAAAMIKHESIPDFVTTPTLSKRPDTILIVNQYLGINYSFMLVKRV